MQASFKIPQIENISAGFVIPEGENIDADFSIKITPSKMSELENDIPLATYAQLETKQDIIEDLSAIREGATLGNTALQPNDDITNLNNNAGYITSSSLPSVYNGTLTIQKNNESLGTFSANSENDKTINIEVPTKASDINALPNSIKYGSAIDLALDSLNYKLTLSLKDQDGTTLNSKTVDFPIESVVVSGSYDNANKKIILTLVNGSTIDVPVGDLVAGLQTEITNNNKLSSDLVSDANNTNKFVTSNEKTTWNSKQDEISDLSTIRSNASNALQPSDVDSTLSATSDNPIANKAVTNALGSRILDFYGTSETAAGTQTKVVVCPDFVLATGVSIRVKFAYGQTYNGQPKLNVNNTGAIGITFRGTTVGSRYMWQAGDVINFTYDGANWIWGRGGGATTSYYGVTKLATSATSTSQALSLTAASLNSFSQNTISGYAVYSNASTYEVGDRCRYSWQSWECTTAIPESEAWNADHWTPLDPLQKQIDDLKAQVAALQ